MKISITKFGVFINSLLFIPVLSFAQITVDWDDLPQAGTTYILQESTPDPLIDYSDSGDGVVWDFSDLDSNSELQITFGDIEDAPTLAQLVFNQPLFQEDHVSDVFGPGDLPNVDEIGIELPIEISSLYNYYQSSGYSFNIAGFSMGAQGIDFPIPYDDIDEIHPIPLIFGDNINSTSAFTAEIPSMFVYSSTGTRMGTVDGWGTLILPNGEEHEVLRLATTLNKSDQFSTTETGDVPFEYETTVYQWIGDGGLPYLEVQIAFDVPFRVRYQGEAPDPSGTEVNNTVIQEDIKMFPNPAKVGSSISLQGLDSGSTWEVRNSTGNICLTGSGTILNTESLSTGAYFLIQKTSNNGLISRPSVFIIQ